MSQSLLLVFFQPVKFSNFSKSQTENIPLRWERLRCQQDFFPLHTGQFSRETNAQFESRFFIFKICHLDSLNLREFRMEPVTSTPSQSWNSGKFELKLQLQCDNADSYELNISIVIFSGFYEENLYFFDIQTNILTHAPWPRAHKKILTHSQRKIPTSLMSM